ncbi:acyltransferase family protein [Actinopolymorpha pittospori]|uniref:Surface polysaccharide O-acyltransferase-like enzyme n=1 Tax=Actinopolymorpha pittospori TaxID=648752 RepID=A0A927R9Y4_9ACTN|nr:surface polysaccharide O-acyltransferase-like enzyme [Actinopolymorpha pittospori]
MRVVSAIAVVSGHVCTHLVWEWGKVSDREWHFGNLVAATSRFSVPLFVMASGAVLLQSGRAQSLRTFYGRRASRLAIPLLVWSCFYVWFSRLTTGQELVWTDFSKLLLLGRPYYHLYFLFVIMGLYLFTPFLRLFIDAAPRKYVVVATALAVGLAFVDKLHRSLTGLGVDPNAFSYFVPWIGYYLLGYVLLTTPMPANRRRVAWIAAATFVGVMLANAMGNWVMHIAFGNRYGLMLYHHHLLGPMIMAISAVFFLRAFLGDGGPVDRSSERPASQAKRPIGQRLADLTLGIYLIHPIPVLFVRDYQPRFSSPWSSIAYHSGAIIAILAVCSAVVWLLRRIPYARRLV